MKLIRFYNMQVKYELMWVVYWLIWVMMIWTILSFTNINEELVGVIVLFGSTGAIVVPLLIEEFPAWKDKRAMEWRKL